MGDRTAKNSGVRHPGQLDVARVDRLAGDFFDPVDAARVAPRDLIGFSLNHDGPPYNQRHRARTRSYKSEPCALRLASVCLITCGFWDCLSQESKDRRTGNENSSPIRAYAD